MTMSKIYRLFAVCCFAWGTFAYAAPDADDPIANLIQQKQTEQDILDQAGLDKLLNEKTKERTNQLLRLIKHRRLLLHTITKMMQMN